MQYKQTRVGTFLSRPNRFVAHVLLDGKTVVCHVKNTGRCRELLTEGAAVILELSENPSRKTPYDLIAVYKGRELINMDSQAPNKAVEEWLRQSAERYGITKIQPECRYGNSRFDFYLEAGDQKIFAEVKGVTLEEKGVTLFPDAPTERGVKHVRELIEAKQKGYKACLIFVIQMQNCRYFTPNRKMHPEFADALLDAQRAGVKICAVNCRVSPDEMTVDRFVEVRL